MGLTIAGRFSDFGSDILDQKKRLHKAGQVEVLENFKGYGTLESWLAGTRRVSCRFRGAGRRI